MTDYALFETRLADALGRYADGVPTEVDAVALTGAIAADRATSRVRRRGPTAIAYRRPVVLVLFLVLAGSIAGVAIFGSQLNRPKPAVVASPEASSAAPTVVPSPSLPSPSLPAPSAAAVLQWTDQDIGTQPAVTSIWRVGEWFVAAGPESSFADDDQPVDARFIRSRDGHIWETVPAPARGLEVETGTVDGGLLWVVGELGTSADPKRGIWTTSDGATWQRVADVTGLDFGPGSVREISRAEAGWLALATRWVDAETGDPFILRSTDGVAWTREPYPDGAGPYDVAGLASDGTQWLLATQGYEQGQPASLEALTSNDGLTWTIHVVDVLPKPGSAGAVTFGPSGFVIVGEILDGEYPHAVAWASPDGTTWSVAKMVGLADPAGETGLRSVVAFDGGYLASGYRLDMGPSFWTSVDGSSWVQVDDATGSEGISLQALAASDDVFVAGGDEPGGPFIWTAPHP